MAALGMRFSAGRTDQYSESPFVRCPPLALKDRRMLPAIVGLDAQPEISLRRLPKRRAAAQRPLGERFSIEAQPEPGTPEVLELPPVAEADAVRQGIAPVIPGYPLAQVEAVVPEDPDRLVDGVTGPKVLRHLVRRPQETDVVELEPRRPPGEPGHVLPMPAALLARLHGSSRPEERCPLGIDADVIGIRPLEIVDRGCLGIEDRFGRTVNLAKNRLEREIVGFVLPGVEKVQAAGGGGIVKKAQVGVPDVAFHPRQHAAERGRSAIKVLLGTADEIVRQRLDGNRCK